MAHVGTLRNFRFQGDIDDIRGSNIYNRNDEKLGDIDDIIFNHENGIIQYLVVDTGGWLSSHKFLVPADRVTSNDDGDRYYVDLSKEQIEAFPKYNESMHEEEGKWDEYENRYRDSWTTSGGILHKEGSQNILTPDASEMPPVSGNIDADVTPTRIAQKFTNTAPTSDKTRLRPEGIASRAEDSKIPGNARADWQDSEENLVRDREQSGISGDVRRTVVPDVGPGAPRLYHAEPDDPKAPRDPDATADLTDAYPVQDTRGRRWRAFEENLRRNRVDITASCHSCSPARDKNKAA